jgi:hypothetical protein
VNVVKACNLIEKYAKCPKCGCEVVGNGKGTLEIEKGRFKRTCSCGWSVVVEDGKCEGE